MIWLASYPRSGNTLLRTILFHSFGIPSWHDEPETRTWKDPELQQAIGFAGLWQKGINPDLPPPHPVCVKTHRPPADECPAIYIVRDPRFVIESYYHFRNSRKPANPVSIQDLILGNDYYGDWSSHIDSWTSRSAPTLTISFEELIHPQTPLLEKIAAFLGHTGRLKDFDVSFSELHHRDPVMFRKGADSPWRRPDHWSEQDETLILAIHGKAMVRLRYASDIEIEQSQAALEDRILSLATAALQANRKCFDALGSAREKEVVIQDLITRIASLDPKPASSRSATDRSAIPECLPPEEESDKRVIKELELQLRNKEDVIQDLLRKNKNYRNTLASLGPIPALANRVHRKVLRLFAPGLGCLNQHPPKSFPLVFRPPAGNYLHTLPRIQLVTPSFNQQPFLQATIESVLGQHYPNLSYHVQDGASTDGSTDVIRSFSDHLTSWASEPDCGQADAINRGFARSQGDIMAWLNSDDLLLPGALLTIGKFFRDNPKVDVVYGHRVLINEDGDEVGRWIMPPHDDNVVAWADYIPQESLFWRKSLWEKCGSALNANLHFAIDWELILRFRRAGARFFRIPKPLGAFRVHPTQKTRTSIEDVGSEEMNQLRLSELGHIPTQYEIRQAIRPYLNRHRRLQAFHRLIWKLSKPFASK